MIQSFIFENVTEYSNKKMLLVNILNFLIVSIYIYILENFDFNFTL